MKGEKSAGAPVSTSVDGDIFIITICRPEKRNAVDRKTATALRDAFVRFAADERLRVAVLTGSGDNFCSGADLSAMADPESRNEIEPGGTGPGPMGPTRMQFDKPVIAAVRGYAVAGGLELALMCDLRVVGRSAIFGVFCRRWGVPLIDGGTVRLPRVVGHGRAMDMILTGRPVGADEALQAGLANRVVEDDQVLVTALELAGDIARFPQRCLRADRDSAYRQWDLTLEEALANEGRGGYPVVSEEAISGAGRFTAGAGRHGEFGQD
ncbi:MULTISPECIES: crotonase/enoyl-CoA hydratase family protein [Microbulbifer]|uniref:crotonase/enoyl-CoA hydratase family protein n=1 Tax=Microbulbifer TaxID=48073 RepID=UPI001E55ADEC|nr:MULTISPECIES: crotonase/enoyl-CoA hydratase family protein [Microbulbifer]UHQ55233.1 crotonase/enoyl-CoA hydratase family protein [Microbulbifer sp. YPW16]